MSKARNALPLIGGRDESELSGLRKGRRAKRQIGKIRSKYRNALRAKKKARKTRAGNFGQALFFDFPVERSALEGRVVLHLLNFFLRLAEIARRHVARGRLAFLARFGAFDYNCFSGHCIPLLKI